MSNINPKPSSTSGDAQDCAICRAPLSSTDCLTLSCNHVFHRTCLKQQLLDARPDPSQRLSFTGYLCPKCRVFCDHPDLKDLTVEPRRLSDDVDRLLLACADKEGTDLDTARRTYAVYLCDVCLDPFIGGTIHCVQDLAQHRLPLEERICPTCVLSHANSFPSVCLDPRHAYAHVWKCRLCCAPADTLYLARTHLCKICEKRFCQDTSAAAIPCEGSTCPCPCPLPPGHQSHFNHSSARGELLYCCAACHTRAEQVSGDIELDDYSHNLIFNPSGALATTGWTHLTTNDRWVAEPSNLVDEPHATNFVSTWTTCAMAQVVDLARHIKEPAAGTILISARFRGHKGHESHYTLQASLLDCYCDELSHVTTGQAKTKTTWETVRLSFAPTPNARFALLAIRGIDDSCSRGTFGSKAVDCGVRVLLKERDEKDVMTGAEIKDTSEEEWTEVAVQTFYENRRRERVEAEEQRVEKAKAKVARREALRTEPEQEPGQEAGYYSEESGRDPEEVQKEFDYPTSE